MFVCRCAVMTQIHRHEDEAGSWRWDRHAGPAGSPPSQEGNSRADSHPCSVRMQTMRYQCSVRLSRKMTAGPGPANGRRAVALRLRAARVAAGALFAPKWTSYTRVRLQMCARNTQPQSGRLSPVACETVKMCGARLFHCRGRPRSHMILRAASVAADTRLAIICG